jgi:hypothetical protein
MRYVIGVVFLGILLTACGANAEPVIVTLAPTATPEKPILPTPVIPPTPTFALMPTITLAPTRTVEQVAANQLPIQPTFTIAPATQTATFQPQLAGLRIEYFITNAEEPPAPGDSITLFWRVHEAEQTRIFRLNRNDRRVEVWEVDTEGRLTVTTDPEEDQGEARFLLRAEASGSVVEEVLTIEMSQCTLVWFFQPAPEDCPGGLPQPSQQVEQRFEGGLMIWLAITQEIYVFYSDGNEPTWEKYPDTFTEGISESDESIIPPEGRLQPIRGFGLVWRENPPVRERLGWAVEAEFGYDGMIQISSARTGEETTYLRVRESGILAVLPDHWEILTATEALDAVPPGNPSLITPTVTLPQASPQ